MGSLGDTVTGLEQSPVAGSASLPDYLHLEGVVPVLHRPVSAKQAGETRGFLEMGTAALSEILATGAPDLVALLAADADMEAAPREGKTPYPPGLPYLTHSVEPPVLVLPETLSPAFQPRTEATWPLVVWHELAHAFLLQNPVPRAPAWMREFAPQTLAAAVARRNKLLDAHLEEIEPAPDLTVREFGGRADAGRQMAFQNALLRLGAAALNKFGEGFPRRLVHALWGETEIVGERRAEELLANSLGRGGRGWLARRPEF